MITLTIEGAGIFIIMNNKSRQSNCVARPAGENVYTTVRGLNQETTFRITLKPCAMEKRENLTIGRGAKRKRPQPNASLIKNKGLVDVYFLSLFFIQENPDSRFTSYSSSPKYLLDLLFY